MTFNRDIRSDQEKVNELLDQDAYSRSTSAESRPNWLGHRGRNADIDALLLNGCLFNELEKHRTRSAVYAHLYHLRKEHGLAIEVTRGFYKFSKQGFAEDFGESEVKRELTDDAIKLSETENSILDLEHKELSIEESTHDLTDERSSNKEKFVGIVHLIKNKACIEIWSHTDNKNVFSNDGYRDIVFLIIGSNRDAIRLAISAVTDLWNIWHMGLDAQISENTTIRMRGDWETLVESGEFYTYEYKDKHLQTFYVGKGTRNRDREHIRDTQRKIQRNIPANNFSNKEQKIATEIKLHRESDLVKKVCSFEHDYAELCAFVAERFLINTIYGGFNLKNDTLGNAKKDPGFNWISKPLSSFSNVDKESVWEEVVKSAAVNFRLMHIDVARLTWIEVEPFVDQVKSYFDHYIESNILSFIRAGRYGQDVIAEWQIVNKPVRVQLIFSRKDLVVRFNLRPHPVSKNGKEKFKKCILDTFAQSYPPECKLIKMPDALDCFFKPYAFDAKGISDISFNYSDPNIAVTLKANWLKGPQELTLSGAMDVLIQKFQ
jgi:hypothetical protein